MTLQLNGPSMDRAMDKSTGWLDRMNDYMAPGIGDPSTPMGMARGSVKFGIWLFVLTFGIIGLWSAFAPLDSAAVAPGKVILSGNKKTLQHLEGGIVEDIFVREGQAVTAGQPLVRLNETQARARLDLFRRQWLASKAAEARLIAERDGSKTISMPKMVLAGAEKDSETREFIDSQQRLFESRRNSIESQTNILMQKAEQYKQEIEGLKSQIASASEQINLLDDEIGSVRILFQQGNAPKPRLLALQRQQAELKGNRGEYRSSISRAEQAIGEADLERVNLINDFQNKVATETRENVEKLADLEERLKASEDIVQRIIIPAPLSGVVTDLQVHTIGGVIRPGDKIMDIVPIDDLVVEAKVSPQDIDVVHDGLNARVRLTAYKARNVPPLEGRVTQVSADRFEDKQSGQAFYLARIRLNDQALEEHKDVELTPGMPADALIITGERTPLQYMFSPITDSFRKAFREQ